MSTVQVYIYDLSRGMAKAMSAMFLGKQLEGIWHTGIVAYGKEWFYGGMGIDCCPPGTTVMGAPDTVHDLGSTEVPQEVFEMYLQEQQLTEFQPNKYNLIEHNCNTFSNEVGVFLTGKGIPVHILDLPSEIFNTPFGQMIRPMIDSIHGSPIGGNRESPFASSVGSTSSPNPTASPISSASSASAAGTGGDSVANVPPVEEYKQLVFRDDSLIEDFGSCKAELADKCNSQTVNLIQELCEYVTGDSKTWSPGPVHVKSLDEVVCNEEISEETRNKTASLLKLAILNEDVIGLVTNEPNQYLQKWLRSIEIHPLKVQATFMQVLTNCGSFKTGREWMMQTKSKSTGDTCNKQWVYKAMTTGLLHDGAAVVEAAASLANNIVQEKMDDDDVVELGTALIEAVQRDDASVVAVEGCLRSLEKCFRRNKQVADLARVMNVDFKQFESKSSECAGLATIIQERHL